MAKAVTWNNVDMLTPGMKNLGNQFNKRWPNRDGTSDGARGDYAHTQENSGHNPDDTKYNNAEYDDNDGKPEIRAIDVDNNLNDPEVSFQDVIDHMRKLPNLGSVIRYMIYNRKMYHVNNDFKPVAYTGASAHTEHGHFSGARSQASDENKTFNFKFDELGEDMPTAKEVADAVWGTSWTNPANKKVTTAAQFQMYNDVVNDNAANKVIVALTPALTKLLEQVNLEPAELAAIKATLAVPTAEQNAEAVVEALGGVDTEDLATALRNALSADQLAALKAAL